MKKVYYLLFSIMCLFSFSSVFAENEIVIKSITPIYDETSTIVVTEENNSHSVIFNDKEQFVEYKIVLENSTDEDLPVESVELSTPSEDFLIYGLEGIDSDDVIEANSTKEIVISLETIEQEGWGRNFKDELVANISFDTSVLDSEPSILNPETGDFILFISLTTVGVAIVGSIFLKKYKFAKYGVIIIFFFAVIPSIKADFRYVIPVEIKASYESQNVMSASGVGELRCYEDDACYSSSSYLTSFWVHGREIKNIYIANNLSEPEIYAYKFDVSEKEDGRVIAYLVEIEDSNYYDLHLQANGIIYANEDASFYFSNMQNLDTINNLGGLDTSKVTNMSHMFSSTGYSSSTFSLDLSNFDTGNVTNMSDMFYETGYSNPSFTLDVSSFDTSNVTDMSRMFLDTGHKNTSFTLDVSNFDTSSVTDMCYMFSSTGYSSSTFSLDLSNFDTSKVTNMRGMFEYTGYKSENLTLDLSSFNTSNVTDMSRMFLDTGSRSTTLTLDLSNFDTSKVTNMSHMFYYTGSNSTTLTLDLSSFDTGNVTKMDAMFSHTGRFSKIFTLDVSNFDTSNVTNMSFMFNGTGETIQNFTLDVSNFDTSNVTSMNSMFANTGAISLDLSNFDTSKVTDMGNMFSGAGGRKTDFTLDVSNFDTSNVRNTSRMFADTGQSSTKLNTSITISNPNTTQYYDMFEGSVYKNGSKITVNYTSETSALVDKMIATKSSDSNVVKGGQVD